MNILRIPNTRLSPGASLPRRWMASRAFSFLIWKFETMLDKTFFTKLFDAAVEAADPDRVIAAHLPSPPKGRTIVIGAGKGSAQMASAFEKAWDGPLEGVVVTRYGFGAPCKHIEIIEASH